MEGETTTPVEEAATEAVETTVETPATEAAAEESATTTAPSEAVETPVEVEGAGEPTESAESAEPADAPVFPDHSTFKWDDWDSKVDSLPEPIRPWAQRVYDSREAWVDQELNTRTKEMDNLRAVYEELLQGNEDPRLADTVSKYEELQKTHNELEEKYKTTAREYEEYITAVNEQVRLQGEAIANQFRESFPEIFEDEAKHALFGELLDEDWDLENIPRVMALGEEAMALARKARAEGTPDVYALQLAERVRSKPAKPRAGARLTAGSEGAAPSANRAEPGKGDARNIDELRSYAIQKAMRSGGKK
jgi:hypothetical protein